LAVAFELLHRSKLAEQNRSLSVKEIDLIVFLVAQVTLLSFSVEMEEACEAVVAKPHALSPVACEVMVSDIISSSATPIAVVDVSAAVVTELYAPSSMACEVMKLQSNIVSSSATPTVVVDVLVTIVGLPSPLVEVVELLAVGVMMHFAVKPLDIAPLEMGPRGALPCSLRNGLMVVKSLRGTLKPLVPHRRLPSKVASWRRLAHPSSPYCCCSFRSHQFASFGLMQGGRGSSWSPWMSRVVSLGFVACGLVVSCLV
jgi:hypothetical protein